MGFKTGIEWTDATLNPLRGCSKVSPGCLNCYAATMAARYSGEGHPFEGLATHTGGRANWTGRVTLVPDKLRELLRKRKPRRIFLNSVSDLFHPEVPFTYVAAIYAVMEARQRHTFQVLTKRPERAVAFFDWLRLKAEESSDTFPADDLAWRTLHACRAAAGIHGIHLDDLDAGKVWPPRNVHLGVSCENQALAAVRVPMLLKCDAAVFWVSAEPLLGQLNLRDLPANLPTIDGTPGFDDYFDALVGRGLKLQVDGYTDNVFPRISWVVAGGESGPKARPAHPRWFASLRDQCTRTSVPFFFKQWGAWSPRGPAPDHPTVDAARRVKLTLCGHNASTDEGYLAERPAGHECEGPNVWMQRIGKRNGGALLEGREWKQLHGGSWP